MVTEELKSQRMPSELSSDCTPSVCIAESNHETNTSATSATTRPRMVNFFNSLILLVADGLNGIHVSGFLGRNVAEEHANAHTHEE